MSDVIVVMHDGRIQQQGRPTELYERPVNSFVANFIGESNPLAGRIVEFDGATRKARVETDGGLSLTGNVTDPTATPEVGTKIVVAVRPERLRVEAAGTDAAESDGWVATPGRIHQGTYLGDQTEYRITTDRAGELVARRQNALGAGTAQGLGPGDPVVVRWHEEANLILVG